MEVNPEMPATLERGMGDCVQNDMLNNVNFLNKKRNILGLNGGQVYEVGEIFIANF